jgi:putative two-component system response regulator
MQRNTILIADDQEINRDMLKVIFEEQYDIVEAADGEEAIRAIEENNTVLSVIFLDFMMPKKSGIEVLEYMKENKYIDLIPVIMVTGEATDETNVKAYECGVSDIIYKPFHPGIIMQRTLNLIELFNHRLNLENQLAERTEELRRSKEKLKKNNDFLVTALSSVVEFRSVESGDHVQRVKNFTKIILRYVKQHYPQYHLTDEQVELITSAAALHDIGKIAIEDKILLKPGKLTKEEFEEMKKHTIYGCQILDRFNQDDSEFFKYCYEICRWHHERDDGRGYPDNLAGDAIPIWAQAVSVADVFDALISKRVYKPSFEINTAIRMIEDGECGKFSDVIMDCFDLAKEELIAAVIGSDAGAAEQEMVS